MSAQCILWNRNLPHFGPLHTDSLALTFLGTELNGTANVHDFFLLPVEFSTIPDHFRQ